MGTDEVQDEELTRMYQVGISAGIEEAATVLMSEASNWFIEGKDVESKMLRSIANSLQRTARERHPGVPK